MEFLARLRHHALRRASLIWLVLAAVVCAPLAQALQASPAAVTVPYCTAHGDAGPAAGPGAAGHAHVVLLFAADAAVGPGSAQLLAVPTAAVAVPHPRLTVAAPVADEVAADVASTAGLRPPSRAPPGRALQA